MTYAAVSCYSAASMIDIHHHCLPNVDDGPRGWDEAVAQCRMAADEGIETIVATPHVLRGSWQNADPEPLAALAAELQERLGPAPRILLGSEYFFAHDVRELLAQKRSIIPLAGGHYVLVEFAANAIPPLIEQVFYHLQLDGWTPVIAHPERNTVFQAKPELLARLVGHGARTQITSGSYTGEFGQKAEACALRWLDEGLVHIVATDAHNTRKRPPRARAARLRVAEMAGERVARALFEDNPRAVIEDRALAWEADLPYPATRPGFFQRLSRVFKIK
jgi:protein-tyrosine phosphatase